MFDNKIQGYYLPWFDAQRGMDERIKQVIDQMPDGPVRSKLDPYADVIWELRRKRKTYAQMAAFLREYCQLSVNPSTIYDFVVRRIRQGRDQNAAQPEPVLLARPLAAQPLATSEQTAPRPPGNSQITSASHDRYAAVRERMRKDKEQPQIAAPKPKLFEYTDEDSVRPLIPLSEKPKEK